MPNLYRIKTTWTGMPGAPGVTTWYMSSVPTTAQLTAMRTFWDAVKAGLPNTLTLQVQGSGDVIEETNGQLLAQWADVQPASVVGTSASGYAAPVGTAVHWLTSAIVNGRKVRGTTFIVPTVNQFEPGGTPIGTWITTVTNAATALWTALGSGFEVYSRKFVPPEGSTRPARDGSAHTVTGVLVPDKAIILRSRRD